jgi:serine/threonine protein kinase
MAPEQLLGREVTQRSDIFALGLVIYELFTGRRAYTATTIGDLVNQHESRSLRLRPRSSALSMPRSITSSCGASIRSRSAARLSARGCGRAARW